MENSASSLLSVNIFKRPDQKEIWKGESRNSARAVRRIPVQLVDDEEEEEEELIFPGIDDLEEAYKHVIVLDDLPTTPSA